MRRLMVDN